MTSKEKNTELSEFVWEQARKHLRDVMSDISEQCYCAGWMSGLEYVLWDAVCTPDEETFVYGGGEILPQRRKHLRELADGLGGWWIWSDLEDDNVFVPMDEWLKLYEARKR